MRLVFATNNPHKLHEIRSMLDNRFELLSLHDIGCSEEVPENGATLESNASEKAHYIFNKYWVNCFADDTGLEIEALNREPGVYSARYAGEQKNPADNIKRVIEKLQDKTNRNARFRCVISLVIDGRETQFEGIVNGKILTECRGSDGFGYDSVFLPDGYSQTFAEMPLDEKNKISHRGRAVQKFILFLTNQNV
ncbi:MAG: non-canonical purine NTP diphosphatase [Bacteroidia bacterium]|nr:non-canonical purine NTP diphosphatase [Bacteroidia bacterium]